MRFAYGLGAAAALAAGGAMAAGFDSAMTAAQTPATAGTICFVTVAKPSGLMLLLR